MNMNDLTHKEAITVDEACLITGLASRTIYNLIKAGKIPGHKPNGKIIYISRQGLIDWMLGR